MVHLEGKVVGPWPVKDLRQLKGFTGQTLVSYPDSGKWAPAFRVFNMNSYEPPVAMSSRSIPETPYWTPPTAVPAFDWKAPPYRERWSDRWFRRLAIFNTLLVVGSLVGWHYPAIRMPLQAEVRYALKSPAAAKSAMLGRALFIKGASSFGFVLPKFVRKLHKVRLPLSRHINVDILKPEV
jgi:hypothetical protein